MTSTPSTGAGPFRVGFIGTGRPHRTEGSTGFGMSHQHAQGYKAAGDAAAMVAFCDLVEENARAFRDEHGDESGSVFTDYHQMLREANLDIVSICTWPALHAPMVIACAEAGVKAIHCEKPIATTYGDARRMQEICVEKGVQLTYNHQRRFLEPFRKAKELLKNGVIGDLIKIECTTSNLYDWGTHWFDMAFMFNDDTPASWVIGQIDLRGHHSIFGAPIEGQGLSHWKFQNGVRGLMITGYDSLPGPQIRLIGSQGIIDVAPFGGGEPQLRVWGEGQSRWEPVPVSENIHGGEAVARGIVDLVECLKIGREPELSGRRALQATEVLFATYESSRRGGRVDLPLDIDDSPLQSLLETRPPQA